MDIVGAGMLDAALPRPIVLGRRHPRWILCGPFNYGARVQVCGAVLFEPDR